MPTILIRRGTKAEREQYTPLVGEIIFDTTENRVYSGDGTTVGGISVNSALPKTTLEREAMTPLLGQLVFDTEEKVLYTGDGSTLGGIRLYPTALTNLTNNVLEFRVNTDTIRGTNTHTITNSYTEIVTEDQTSDSNINDTPVVSLTGNPGSLVYVYFKTAGTRTQESEPYGTTTRNITVESINMNQGDFKTFFKTTDGWREL